MAESPLQIDIVASAAMSHDLRRELLSLCSRAYGEDFAPYLAVLSPAVHLLGFDDGHLVSHAAWMERELRIDGIGRLRTAYVEAVATLPAHQRRGHASALMKRIPRLVADFSLAALSPSNEHFYRRLGWEKWQGRLSFQDASGREIETPDEQLMIYRLPLTPPSLDPRAKVSTDWRPLEVW